MEWGCFMNTKILGNAGEDTAVLLVEERGFDIVERNYRYRRYGEIDIIARRGELLAFIEVKTRRGENFGGPLRSISERKMRTMRVIAEQFLATHPRFRCRAITCRFDLIAIIDGRINWIEDSFR